LLAVAEANEQAAQYAPSYEDLALVVALRDGDEAAFVELVRRYRAPMLKVARLYVPTQAVAEEVVQDTWIGVLNGIARFEGRSSFKTWLFRILTNTAQTRAARERRTVPFSSFMSYGSTIPSAPRRNASAYAKSASSTSSAMSRTPSP